MKKQKSLRALLMSMLSLLLCVSMLVGSTFAWFTDEVVTGMNTIAAGNLDVELLADGGEVNSATKLFDDVTLWEPGVVVYENLQVVNKGTLALKYQLSLTFGGENELNGHKLSEVLQIALVDEIDEQNDTRAEILAAAQASGNIGTLADFLVNGTLEAGTSSNVQGVVIFWAPNDNDYDNLFNANNDQTTSDGEALRIEFGVNLFATQFTYEEDSFNKYYDEAAAVFTVAEANALMAQNKDANLVGANEPNSILYIPANFTGTLVLNNVKVASVQESEPVATVAEGETVVVVPAATEHKIIVLGNVVVKATADGMSAITGTKLNIDGNGTLTAIAKGKAAFGIGGMTTESVTVSGITIKEVAGGFAGEIGTDTKYYKDAPEGGAAIGSGLNGAVITLNDVEITKAVGGSKAAAIGARYWTGVTVNIANSVIKYAEGGATAAAIGSSRVSSGATENGTTINITGSTITAKGGVYGAGIGSGYDTHCQAAQPLCTINIANSNIKATGGQYAAGVGTGYHNAALAGEIKNSTITAASGEKFYKNSYTAAMDLGFGVVDPDREGQQTDSYITVDGVKITMSDAPASADSSNLTEAVKAGGEVVLKAGTYTFPASSIKADTTLICEPGTVFEGATKLNINGATVVGATFSNPSGVVADQTVNGVFKDCTFKGSSALRWCYAGETVVFENCVFDGKTYGVHFDGGANEVVFRNCTFSGFNAMGGEVKLLTMENCTFKALGNSNYNGINLWGNTNMIGCTFVFDGSVGNEWCDARGNAGSASYNVNFTNCVVIDANGTSQSIQAWGKVGNENDIAVISYN